MSVRLGVRNRQVFSFAGCKVEKVSKKGDKRGWGYCSVAEHMLSMHRVKQRERKRGNRDGKGGGREEMTFSFLRGEEALHL